MQLGDTPPLDKGDDGDRPAVLRQHRLRRPLGLLLRLATADAPRHLARSLSPGVGPKDEELVATPYRHGGKDAAEQFFMEGMGKALRNMHASGTDDFPVTVYYAFKQAEIAKEGLTSAGWATFLQGLFDAGYVIDGTWPVRTELSNRPISLGRKRPGLVHRAGLPEAAE